MSTLVVVDGSNVVSCARRSLLNAHPKKDEEISRYVHEWFDLDRFVEAIIGTSPTGSTDLGTVVFHSTKSLGGKGPHELSGHQPIQGFWARQGAGDHVSCRLVDIPGSKADKETGLDVAVVVYLFETVERWNTAFLFTDDADYVPAVWALRHRGKRIFCSGPRESESPLVQACQQFFPWRGFLEADFAVFQMLTPKGPLLRLITSHDPQPKATIRDTGDIELRIAEGAEPMQLAAAGEEFRKSCPSVVCGINPSSLEFASAAYPRPVGRGVVRHWDRVLRDWMAASACE